MLVATVLTVYGIETSILTGLVSRTPFNVATVLTVYGIETTVYTDTFSSCFYLLQQYLPFTVLKLRIIRFLFGGLIRVATVLTVYGIETQISLLYSLPV